MGTVAYEDEHRRPRRISAFCGQGREHELAELDPCSAKDTVEDLSSECEGRYVADCSFEKISSA